MHVLIVTTLLFLAATAAADEPVIVRFQAADLGKLPGGWRAERTGEGEGSVWKVVADASTPSKSGFALAQTAKGPRPLFNLAVYDGPPFLNGKLSVRFKSVSGEIDQGGGLCWRYQDAKNYYVARFNPLENNFRFYKVIDGKRLQLANKEPLELPANAWHQLEIEHVGNKITCSLNGVKHLEAVDDAIARSGLVGLWTKADAQTHFDDLVITRFASKPSKVEADGLHNVLQVHPRLLTGSVPEGETGFASLAKLGVKTILSVDGARPDVETARKHGLRYVHVPIGYDGVAEDRLPLLIKAMQEAQGPIYVHCHHGKHRSPTAAALGLLSLDRSCRVEDALAVLQMAGTDPKYKGLFASVRNFQPPSAQDLAKLPAELPEVFAVSDLTSAMVVVDHHFDNVKQVRKANWKAPPESPDVEPSHEAKLLLQSYEAMNKLPIVTEKPADFRQWLADGLAASRILADGLRGDRKLDPAAVEKAFEMVSRSCSQCHAKYRDVK